MKLGERFEILTKQIIATISRVNKYKTVTLRGGSNNVITGKSGCKHQIDVYWEYVKEQKLEKVIIECKDYGKAVSIGRVRDFFGVKHDIGDVNAWIISSHGFQKGARLFAEYYDIQVKTLQWFKHLEVESNTPDAFLKIVSFSIENKKYEVGDTTDVSKKYKFSSCDSRHVDLEIMEFVSLIESKDSFKTNHKNELFSLPQKWMLSSCEGLVKFDQVVIEYKYIAFTPSVVEIQESGVKLTHLESVPVNEYYIDAEKEDL